MIDKNTLRQFLRSNPFPTKLGDITITREIGEGANGLVYEGVLNGNPVAVKFLVEAHSQKLTRFKAEFFNVLLLPINQFVARPLFYDELQLPEASFPGIVLQKYDGNLQRPNNPTKETLRSLTEFLLNALNFIHSHGIIHRDIKPANILVDGKEYALADFGIASYNPDLFHLKAETKSEERLANRLFSAPEQEDGGIQAHATMDIYALGQVIQWFVTGSVHRGTKRTRISSVLPDSDEYDFIVESLFVSVRRCYSSNGSQACSRRHIY
jgi:serine/threonine-protein kinase